MAGFVTWWVGLALGTFMWIVITETLIWKVRGAAFYMELKKRLGEDHTPWHTTAYRLLFMWWILLGLWVWGASKGRSFTEHLVLLKENALRMKAEAERLKAESRHRYLERRAALLQAKLTEAIRQRGWDAEFTVEICSSEDGIEDLHVALNVNGDESFGNPHEIISKVAALRFQVESEVDSEMEDDEDDEGEDK